MAEPILPERLQYLRNHYINPETKIMGITQEELSQTLGVSLSSVKKWETGESIPSTDAIAAMCELYQTVLYFSPKEVHPLIQKRKNLRQNKDS